MTDGKVVAGRPRIFLVEDHAVFRAGVRAELFDGVEDAEVEVFAQPAVDDGNRARPFQRLPAEVACDFLEGPLGGAEADADERRAGGAQRWTIWRSGTDLFHVIECEDYAALLAYLNEQPANAAWQARMAELLDVVHDYSCDGAAAALPVVWEL